MIPITGCYEINVINKQLQLRDQTRVTTNQHDQETRANALRHSIQVSCSHQELRILQEVTHPNQLSILFFNVPLLKIICGYK